MREGTVGIDIDRPLQAAPGLFVPAREHLVDRQDSMGGRVAVIETDRFARQAGTGETFAVVPLKDQYGPFECGQYADLIAQQLAAKGYGRVAQPAGAKYAVLFSYTIDRGKTTEVPLFGQTSGGVETFSGNTSGTVGGTPYSGV